MVRASLADASAVSPGIEPLLERRESHYYKQFTQSSAKRNVGIEWQCTGAGLLKLWLTTKVVLLRPLHSICNMLGLDWRAAVAMVTSSSRMGTASEPMALLSRFLGPLMPRLNVPLGAARLIFKDL